MNDHRASLAELGKFSDFILENSLKVKKSFEIIQEHIDYRYTEVKDLCIKTVAALEKNSRSDDVKSNVVGMQNDIYMLYRPLEHFSTGPIQTCKDLHESAEAVKKYTRTNNQKNLNNHDVNIPNMKKRYDSVRKLQDDFERKYETFYKAMAPIYVKIRKIYHSTTNGAANKFELNRITRSSEQLASIRENNGNEKTNLGGTRRHRKRSKRSKRTRRNRY